MKKQYKRCACGARLLPDGNCRYGCRKPELVRPHERRIRSEAVVKKRVEKANGVIAISRKDVMAGARKVDAHYDEKTSWRLNSRMPGGVL